MAGFVLSAAVVRQAHNDLRSRKSSINSKLSGYLAALYHADGKFSTPVAVSDLKPFFDRFLRPANGPADSPWYAPWARSTDGHGWINENLAGMYAPSSAAAGPFGEVMTAVLKKEFKGFAFKPDHALRARKALLNDQALPAVDVGVFLLRDFAFEDEERDAAAVVHALRRTLGLAAEKHDDLFNQLFDARQTLSKDAFVEVKSIA